MGHGAWDRLVRLWRFEGHGERIEGGTGSIGCEAIVGL